VPNRILRDGILRSERVAKLSPTAELFYRRLMSVVDDFGRYYANESLLLSDCYPIRPEWADIEMISRCLGECSTNGLISTYEVSGTRFLEILNFGQRIRSERGSKFPSLADGCGDPPQAAASRARSSTSTPSYTTPTPSAKVSAENSDMGEGPIETIQGWLQQYVRHFGKQWPLPDQAVCFSVFRAMNGATLDDLEGVLRDLYAKKQSPGRNYAWFVPVISARFEGNHVA
jgi:hypothetical protein